MLYLVAIFLHLWVGWGTTRPFQNVTATIVVRQPSVGISDPWVGINTSNGGLVQTGVMVGDGNLYSWQVWCYNNSNCYPRSNADAQIIHVGDRVKLGVAYLGGGRYRLSTWDITRHWSVWRFVHKYGKPYSDVWIAETQSYATPNVPVYFINPTSVGRSLQPIPNTYAGLCPTVRFVIKPCSLKVSKS